MEKTDRNRDRKIEKQRQTDRDHGKWQTDGYIDGYRHRKTDTDTDTDRQRPRETDR